MSIDIRNTEVNQQATVTKYIADKTFVAKLKSGDTTPSVRAMTVCKANGQDVTDFKDGAEGQTIKVLGDGTMTVEHGSNIKTNTAAIKTLESDKVYTFTHIDGVWYEDATYIPPA
jgi:hypothetical protein